MEEETDEKQKYIFQFRKKIYLICWDFRLLFCLILLSYLCIEGIQSEFPKLITFNSHQL
jgi:hypothetical protein